MAWSDKKGRDLAAEVENIADGLRRDQAIRTTRYLRNLRLFESLDISTADARGYYRADTIASTDDPLGLLRSAVQTCGAEVFAKQKPKPQFQTSGADWRTRRKAKKLDKICEGVLHQRQGRWLDTWELVYDAGIECMIQGTAPIYVFFDEDEGLIRRELVPVNELFVDPCEGRDPLNLFRVSPIDEDKAIARFASGDSEGDAKRRAAIQGAQEYNADSPIGGDSGGAPRATRALKMVSAWRLPKGPGKPGKAVIVIGGEIMAEEDWTAKMFPFVFAHWEPHRKGFWASGLIDEGFKSAEDAGDYHERLYSRAVVCGGKRTYAFVDTIANKEAFERNDEDVLIEVDKSAPGLPQETVTPPFTDSEFQFSRALIQMFFDRVGVSQVSAAARREPGVESAVAMRTLNDTKSGRQLPRAKMYEKLFVDLALQDVARFREQAERNEGKEFTVRWPGKNILNEVKWSDADPEEDANFSVTVAPASALPNDPAGRLSMVGEMFQSKLIDAQTYKQLLGWPDLEQELDSESAEYEYIDQLIDRYLDAEEEGWTAGDYESPEGAILDKPRALMRFTAAMFQAKRDRAPDFNVSLLRRYIGELSNLISAAVTAQQELGAGVPGSPVPNPQPQAA